MSKCNCKKKFNSKSDNCFCCKIGVISDPNRLKILRLLHKGELCVCHIYEKLGLSQNLTSHHLKVLTDANLLTSRRDGKKIYYKINKTEVEKLNKLLELLISK